MLSIVPSGFSRLRVERAPSIRELYLRLIAISGPLTVTFFCGVELSKTAWASAIRGLKAITIASRINTMANCCGRLIGMTILGRCHLYGLCALGEAADL